MTKEEVSMYSPKVILKNYRFTITLKKSKRIIVGVRKAPNIPTVRDYVDLIGFNNKVADVVITVL